jgi:PIN domain nuclease of toxin-antitoxin system
MKLLLDTHAWLWFHLGDPQLSQAARQHILDPAHAKFVSPASFWEISIKISLGKYALSIPYREFMSASIAGHGFRLLDITPAHTELVASMPFPTIDGREHRDPFDRLLISQARAEGMSLVSDDAKFPAYAVPIVW